MSTLEKAISLLKDMPKQKIETVYAFIQFINCQTDENFTSPIPEKKEKSKSITLRKRNHGTEQITIQFNRKSPLHQFCQALCNRKPQPASLCRPRPVPRTNRSVSSSGVIFSREAEIFFIRNTKASPSETSDT